MNPYHQLKKLYGVFLTYWRRTFLYPRYEIPFSNETNYDSYWRTRRAGGMGKLSPWQLSRTELAVGIIRKVGGKGVIGDIGCGDGAVLAYLHEQHLASQMIGYDSSPLALEAAEKKGVTSRMLDLNKPQWQEEIEHCDYTILFEIIEHVSNSEELVQAALQKSRRGVFISIPNSGFLLYRIRLLFGQFPMQWVLYPNEHLRFWTLRDMRWWLKALGLSSRSRVVGYRGVPILNKLYPALFAAGLFIWISNE